MNLTMFQYAKSNPRVGLKLDNARNLKLNHKFDNVAELWRNDADTVIYGWNHNHRVLIMR